MGSITDVVKEGMKYPFNDGKKVLTLGVIFLASSLISLLMQYFVFDNIRVMSEHAPIDTIQAAFAAIPPSNMALMVLSWIAILALMLFCSGYIYNVIKYGIEGRYELPGFSDIKGIFLNGIRSFIVGIAYSILPMILFILGIMLAVNESVGATVNSIGAVIIFISIVFAIFVAFVQIMALCHMVDKDELSAAFRFKEIFELIRNIGWGRFIGIIVFTIIVVGIVSVFLSAIFGLVASIVSIALGSALALALVNIILDSLLVNPYVSIVVSRVYGSVYNEAAIEN